jgi:apolipoprotein N-acyltransferase
MIMVVLTCMIGPIGTHHQQGNVFRAVENGFTLFRCVSQGVSGVFEPTLNGIFNQKVASLNVEQYLFYLPLQKRITTLYGCIGDSFSYLCLIGSVTLLAFVYRHRRKQSQIMLFADI